MRIRVFTTFLVAVLLLAGSFSVMIALSNGNDFGITMNATTAPPFSGGDGSSGNPFKITNVSQLQNMSANLSAHYVLINDIDASGTAIWNSGAGFSPIGASSNRFYGTIHGNDFNITNLTINRPTTDDVGLFGFTGTGSFITRVHLVGLNVTGKEYVGGLVGQNYANVTGCSVDGNVATAKYTAGVFAGVNFGHLENCTSAGNVLTAWASGGYAGGFIGVNNAGANVINCSSSANVTMPGGIVGGFVAYAFGGEFRNCSATGDVTAGSSLSGGFLGLTGDEYCLFIDCYATGDVKGTWGVGGFAGMTGSNKMVLKRCYSTGNVQGTNRVGGFVAYCFSGATECHSSGNVSGMDQVGGFVGLCQSLPIIDCYSTGEVYGMNDRVGGFCGYNEYGNLVRCRSYGNATGDNEVGGSVGRNSGFVKNCSGYGNAFGNDTVGGFVGYNYAGSALNSRSYGNAIGLNHTGGFAGENNAFISRSINYGIPVGNRSVGGFVGTNHGVVAICNTSQNASGSDETGGFAGNNTGVIENAYATGDASGDYFVGGFAGRNWGGHVEHCYSTGTPTGLGNLGGFMGNNTGTNLFCFWDTDISGILVTEGGTGKTTAQMKSNTTFIGADWNFWNLWTMVDTVEYPHFIPQGGSYVITNVYELQMVNGDPKGYYVLANDIEANVTEDWNSGAGFLPIAADRAEVWWFQGEPFAGSLDFKDFTISNLTINRSGEDYVGLFGWATPSQPFSNLTLTGLNVAGKDNTGGLAGLMESTTVDHIEVSGNISGGYYTGGLAGETHGVGFSNCTTRCEIYNSKEMNGGLIGYAIWLEGIVGRSIVKDCDSYSNVTGGGKMVGGLIGSSSKTPVIGCNAFGNVNGSSDYTGGLIGYHNTGILTECNAYGNVYGGNDYIGGLTGRSWSATVIDCNAYGDTYGGRHGTGGLVGKCWDSSISECSAFGKVTSGGNDKGGLVGENQNGVVSNCKAYGHVSGANASSYGGLVGTTNGGSISTCAAYGDVNGYDRVGGLVGFNQDDPVSDCYAYGNVTGRNLYAGGIVGYSQSGSITRSGSYGYISGFESTGGLVGGTDDTSITDCNSYGATTGSNKYVGGLVGSGDGKISECNTYGDTSGTDEYVGGLIGYSSATVSNCTTYGNTTGLNYTGGVFGYHVPALSIDAYYCVSWGNTTGTNHVGGIAGYNDNQALNRCRSKGNITGTGYDVGGIVGWSRAPIINCDSFSGIVDGVDRVGGIAGYMFKNYVENCTSYGDIIGYGDDIGGIVGLQQDHFTTNCTFLGKTTGKGFATGGILGRIVNGSVIECSSLGDTYGNVSTGGVVGVLSISIIEDSTGYGEVSGANNTGGFTGFSNGTILRCEAYGDVTGSDNVGGFLGKNTGSGNVTQCLSKGNVSGVNRVGGFTGSIDSTTWIYDCYSHSDTTGSDSVGGLIGSMDGANVTDCYSIGLITSSSTKGGLIGNNSSGSVTGCVWDYQTSGLLGSYGGVAKSTKEMKIPSTYVDMNWDFFIWAIKESYSYPYFSRMPWNDAPIAMNDSRGTNEDLVLSVTTASGLLVNDADPDLDPISVIDHDAISSMGAVVTVNPNGSYMYDPTAATALQSLNKDATIVDTFSYTISDGNGLDDSTVVKITVTGINDAPTAIHDSNATDEDSILSVPAPGLLANDIDIDTEDSLMVSGLLESKYKADITVNPDGSYTYDPTGVVTFQALGSGEQLNDTFNYTVSDMYSAIDVGIVRINVTGVNDAPVADDDSINIIEDSGPNAVSVLANDDDIDGDTLTITHVTQGTHGNVTIAGDGSGLTYEPYQDFVGRDEFTYNISDGNGGIDTASVIVYIDNTNDAPVWMTVLKNQNITEGDALYLTAVATDMDSGDTINYSISSDPNSGITINSKSGAITWSDPQKGDYKLTVFASDGIETINQTFNLTVKEKEIITPPEPTNKIPVIDPIHDQETTVGESFKLTVSGSDADTADANKLVFSLISAPAGMVMSKDGSILWIPDEIQISEHTVIVSITDGKDSNSTSFNITVKEKSPIIPPKNNPPTITPVTEEQTGEPGEKYSIKISGADSDVGDTLTFTLQDKPSGMVISKDGEILWIPQDDQVGTHTVIVALSDGKNTTTMSFYVIIEEAEKVKPEESEKEKETKKEFSIEEGMSYLLILLIVGLIIGLLIGMAMARKKKPTEDIDEEEKLEDEELEDEELEDEMPEEDVPEDEISEDELEEEEFEDEELDEDELEE